MRDGCGTQWAWEPGKQYAWPTEGLPDQQVHQVWTGQLQQTLHLKSNQSVHLAPHQYLLSSSKKSTCGGQGMHIALCV